MLALIPWKTFPQLRLVYNAKVFLYLFFIKIFSVAGERCNYWAIRNRISRFSLHE